MKPPISGADILFELAFASENAGMLAPLGDNPASLPTSQLPELGISTGTAKLGFGDTPTNGAFQMPLPVVARILTIVALCAALPAAASAHPGSGIVVDAQGQVFFQDSGGRAIWKIDAAGTLTKLSDKIGEHWMALDTEGHFARVGIH
ncbi:MAG TPA: hypothetical protein VGP68_03120 [Gemmataceae bacterium]|nr:hypothetical protein [Gemmataceae bacterium]